MSTEQPMSLVPETYYTHDEFGRVELVDVRPDDVVCMSTDTDRLEFEPVAAFHDRAEPAPMTIDTPAATMSGLSRPPE